MLWMCLPCGIHSTNPAANVLTADLTNSLQLTLLGLLKDHKTILLPRLLQHFTSTLIIMLVTKRNGRQNADKVQHAAAYACVPRPAVADSYNRVNERRHPRDYSGTRLVFWRTQLFEAWSLRAAAVM